MTNTHVYELNVRWTGDPGGGTDSYTVCFIARSVNFPIRQEPTISVTPSPS